MPLATSFRATLTVSESGANDFGGPVFAPTLSEVMELTNGTGALQADQCWFDERTVASGANDDLDLAGSLTSAFGSVLTIAKLVAIAVINAPRVGAANTTNLTIGGGTNPFVGFLGGTTPTIGPIRPGGFVILGCGDTVGGIGSVVAGTGDILRIANSAGAAATYQIALIGRSA